MAEVLIFGAGILLGMALRAAVTEKREKSDNKAKYQKYKTTSGLYEGVRRK